MDNANTNHSLHAHLQHEHESLKPHLDSILTTAHAIGVVPISILRDLNASVLSFLIRDLESHARAEDTVLYPALDAAVGTPAATEAMRRDHTELGRMTQQLSDLQGTLMLAHEPSQETLDELRRVLYGIHAIIDLHLAKEDEILSRFLAEHLSPSEQERVLLDLRHKVEH